MCSPCSRAHLGRVTAACVSSPKRLGCLHVMGRIVADRTAHAGLLPASRQLRAIHGMVLTFLKKLQMLLNHLRRATHSRERPKNPVYPCLLPFRITKNTLDRPHQATNLHPAGAPVTELFEAQTPSSAHAHADKFISVVQKKKKTSHCLTYSIQPALPVPEIVVQNPVESWSEAEMVGSSPAHFFKKPTDVQNWPQLRLPRSMQRVTSNSLPRTSDQKTWPRPSGATSSTLLKDVFLRRVAENGILRQPKLLQPLLATVGVRVRNQRREGDQPPGPNL